MYIKITDGLLNLEELCCNFIFEKLPSMYFIIKHDGFPHTENYLRSTNEKKIFISALFSMNIKGLFASPAVVVLITT